ncbi:MAG: YajD family HNH nuclease [Kiritimatiellia bacterium]|nr:YajD family HNH nuclease [Kiritimatiellia bacterium]
MIRRQIPLNDEQRAKIITELRKDVALRQRGYRERALRIFPHICAKCSREFEGRRLKELTVHHKDHNHDHNPPDGSNWELLCVYCHDDEHEKFMKAGMAGAPDHPPAPSVFAAFEGLDALLKAKHPLDPDKGQDAAQR